MKQYRNLLEEVLNNGVESDDRTQTGTLSVFGRQCRYNLRDGFPAVTTKKLFFKGVVAELLWFLKGSTNVKWLQEQGVHIWDAWADKVGNLGPVYGAQWRKWETVEFKTKPDPGEPITWDMKAFLDEVDQIKQVIGSIKESPYSRRHVVSAWNPGQLYKMRLPPCHLLFQFYVRNGELSCQLYQRSADLFLGVPFNIASYALLTHMIAQVCGLKVGDFVHTIGDAHIYKNHIEQVELQLSRTPFPQPTLYLNPEIMDIDSFSMNDARLENYQHHPSIKAEIAV